MCYVPGPGVEPGLGDYEPPVQPYTTLEILKKDTNKLI